MVRALGVELADLGLTRVNGQAECGDKWAEGRAFLESRGGDNG